MDVNDVEPGGATSARPPPRRSRRKRETVNYVVGVKGGVPEGAMASLPPLPTRKRRTRKQANPVGDVPMELDDAPHKEGEGTVDGESGRMAGETTVSLTPPAKRRRRKRSLVNAAVDTPMELDDPPHEEDEEMEAESVPVVPGEFQATPVRRNKARRKVDPVVDIPSAPDDPPQGDGETEVESGNLNASVESTTPPPPPRRGTRARGTVNYVVDVPLDLDDF